MNKLFFPAFALFAITACGSDFCETVSIPVYSVSVVDSITGQTLCEKDLYFATKEYGSSGLNCKVSYSPSVGNENAGDISVEMDGYKATIKEAVPNKEKVYKCFNSFDYTEKVIIYIEPV